MEVLLENDCRVVFTLLSVVDLAYSSAIPEAIIRIYEVLSLSLSPPSVCDEYPSPAQF